MPTFRTKSPTLAALLCTLLAACGGGSTPEPAAQQPTLVPTATSGGLFGPHQPKARPEAFAAGQNCPPFTNFGSPSRDIDFLCRTAFAIGHDADARAPLWVIERLSLNGPFGGVERTDNFRADPDLAPGRRAELSDYVGSGYDRGHMAPAGDLTFSNQAMSESFYLSNIAPQDPTLNRGAWAKLEDSVRSWLAERPELYVITGPMYGPARPVIGKSPVRVPYAFFKVVYDPNRREVVAFVYTNAAPAASDLIDHRVPIEQLEATTGLHFINLRQ
jgi:endonuclease G